MTAPTQSRILTTGLIILAAAYLGTIGFLVLGAPQGFVGYRTAFDTLRTLGWVGLGGAAISIIALLARKRLRISPLAALAATLLFAVPVAVMIANEATPPPGEFINDITTDLEDPPEFSAVIPLRPAGSNPIAYGGPEVAARQREAHPEVAPIFSALDPQAAFQRAFETAESLGWEVVSGDLQSGIIEAVDTTRFFRFKDDVIIRIREDAGGSRIDLRSRSRVGRSDLGKNAKRILAFADAFTR
ncbi:MAG: DUF1499 domain-containing protein [Gammaproteobacteria bacterium]